MNLPVMAEELAGIRFYHADLIPELQDEPKVVAWLEHIFRQEFRIVHILSYIFTDDSTLLKINKEFLDHDALTDIITFPYASNPVEAEIYISVDRVRENAQIFEVPVSFELCRVMAHGVLHLCGWADKTAVQSALIRKREDACLALL
jgi:rRNA maturation RNase YbeY